MTRSPAQRPDGAWCAGLLALACLGSALAFYRLGGIALLDPDEARFAETAREMMERGDLAVPYFNGEPNLKKPPLLYWEQISFFHLLGLNEYAARLPSALAYLALAGVLVLFSRRFCGRPVALRAGAIFLTTPLAILTGRAGTTDMTLTLLVTLALLCYFLIDQKEIPSLPGTLLMGGLVGLAILAKGPVGLLIPLLVVAAFHGILGEWKSLLDRGRLALVAGVGACVGLGWALSAAWRVGFSQFFATAWSETGVRYFATGLEHPESPFFFFLATPLALFPWSTFLLPAYLTGARRYVMPRQRLQTFLWVWIAVVFLFFSLGHGKLASYVLPLVPPVAIFLGLEWERWSSQPATSEWYLAIVLFALIGVVTALSLDRNPDNAPIFWAHAPYMLGLAALCVLVALVSGWLDARRLVVPIYAATIAASILFLVHTEAHKLGILRSARGIVQEAGLDRQPGVRLCAYKRAYPSLIFYAQRRVEMARNAEELRAFLREPGDAVVLMPARRAASLPPDLKSALEPLAAQGHTAALRKLGTPAAAPPAPSPDVR